MGQDGQSGTVKMLPYTAVTQTQVGMALRQHAEGGFAEEGRSEWKQQAERS